MMASPKEQITEEKVGFKPCRGCRYQIFVLKQLVKKYKEKRKGL